MDALRFIFYYCFLLFCGLVSAQEKEKNSLELQQRSIATLLNTSLEDTFVYYTYQIILGEVASEKLDASINLRVEDVLTSEETYVFFNDISFFDISVNYRLKNINFNLLIENALGYNSNVFDIEPNLVNNAILFSHEAHALLSASITYNF